MSLFGYRDHPPVDVDGFWSFAAKVTPPDVFADIRNAELLDRIVAHRFDSNLRRRYEHLRRFPAGLLITGDALCSFNPIYGQGMTVAALEASALQRCLQGGDHHLTRRFFAAIAKVVDHAWQMATSADLALPNTEGPRTCQTRLANAYLRRLLTLASNDPTVLTAFIRVVGMLDPLPTLLRPAIALRMLHGSARTPSNSAAQQPAAPSSVRYQDVPATSTTVFR